MKGKESLSDKISTANIMDWKDHRWITSSFFLNYKRSFKDQGEIKATYGKFTETPDYISIEAEDFMEDSPEYTKLNDKDKLRKSIDEYGNILQDQYLKKGLSHKEVEIRREIDGPNKMPDKKKTPWYILLIHELTSIFSILLWVGGALAMVGYGLTPDDKSNFWLAIVLWIVVLITGIFAFWQNTKSDSIIDSFQSFSNAKATVIRDGVKIDVNAVDLVAGDVCEVSVGQKIPADIRIFEASALSVNNSGLTGESEAIKIDGRCGKEGIDSPLEAKNLCFFSTLCVSGIGKGVVIRIGKDTFMGKIADLTHSAETIELTLEKEMNKFIGIISIIACSLGLAFFFGSIGIGFPLIASFAFAIGIIVANVPEGLLTCLTVTLALTAYELFKINVMVKNMGSVETLGSITCICSDKTGTLTQNRMTVVHLWYDCEMKKLKENQEDIYVDEEKILLKLFNKEEPTFKFVKFTAICGSKSSFKKETPEDYTPLIQARNKWKKENKITDDNAVSEKVKELKKDFQEEYDKYYSKNIDERFTDGDASEAGIIKFFEKLETIDKERERYPQHRYNGEDIKIPFDSKIKCAGSVRKIGVQTEDNDAHFWLAFKGAPDFLIKKCTHYMLNGKEYEMDDFFRNKFELGNKTFALKGERVLALAYYKFKKSDYPEDFAFNNDIGGGEGDAKIPNYPVDQLCFVGLIGMEDPPREGVQEAISHCKEAGIKVIMVTGDQTLTAASIAYQIGIIEDLMDTPEVIMAKEKLKTIEEAEKKSNTIIIDGVRLARMTKLDELLSEDNPNKGAFLRNCLMKRDVVFARTSPDQKLIIVDACQKLSHIVAVTGDGVNDSPAIKKANIGIAMGKVGTDVAKDAADILLMDDNFANIIKGIERGRIIFDTLKKIISYNLSSNISELMPVVAYFIFQFPIPLTTILILTIDIGSDVYPNVAFAYEGAEADIMKRPPRNGKVDNLCTLKLFAWSYLHMGMVEMTAGMLAYFVVMNDYGFKPGGIIQMTTEYGVEPAIGDRYNPYDEYKGNTNAFIYENSDYLGYEGEPRWYMEEEYYRQIDYISNEDNALDFRMMLYKLPDSDFGDCEYPTKDNIKDTGKVCYTLDAIRHAQSAYLANTVLVQVSNGFCYRTITVSMFEHILSNWDLNFAYILENAIMCILIYVPGLNYGLALRPIIIQHWAPCMGAFIILFAYSEFTKYMIRNQNNPDGSKGYFHKYYRY